MRIQNHSLPLVCQASNMDTAHFNGHYLSLYKTIRFTSIILRLLLNNLYLLVVSFTILCKEVLAGCYFLPPSTTYYLHSATP